MVEQGSKKCLVNKVISYRQTGAIQFMKALKSFDFVAFEGVKFSVLKGEVIEVAPFDKVIRDCQGELLEEYKVIRFRKVATDEWISFRKEVVESYLESYFTEATELEHDKQTSENYGLNKEYRVINVKKVEIPSYVFLVVGLGIGVLSYKLLNKNK